MIAILLNPRTKQDPNSRNAHYCCQAGNDRRSAPVVPAWPGLSRRAKLVLPRRCYRALPMSVVGVEIILRDCRAGDTSEAAQIPS
jgi:hypothetical protein